MKRSPFASRRQNLDLTGRQSGVNIHVFDGMSADGKRRFWAQTAALSAVLCAIAMVAFVAYYRGVIIPRDAAVKAISDRHVTGR